MNFIIKTDQFPNKNPLGYTRTTQRGRFDPKYRLYEAWKDWVWLSFSQQVRNWKRIPDKQKFFLSTMIYYNNDVRADPSNVFKGIEDALADSKKKHQDRLYKDDKWATGRFEFQFDPKNPRVECMIFI